MPDNDWLKAQLEKINDRTELTNRLLEQRLETLSEKVEINGKRSRANEAKIHAMEVADAKASGAVQSATSLRSSAFTKWTVIVGLVFTALGSCVGGLGFLWQLFTGS